MPLFKNEDIDTMVACMIDTCFVAAAVNPEGRDRQYAVDFIVTRILSEAIDRYCPEITDDQLETFIRERCCNNIDDAAITSVINSLHHFFKKREEFYKNCPDDYFKNHNLRRA